MPGGNSLQGEPPKSTLITTTGTTSKIIHPPEDVSLEELRARKPKYARKIATAVAMAANHSAQHSSHTNSSNSIQTSTASLVSAAHEVSIY